MPSTTSIVNRPDEWKIEQGLHGAKLPIFDQTGSEEVYIEPSPLPELKKDASAIEALGNRDELFTREREGWKGYGFLQTYCAS